MYLYERGGLVGVLPVPWSCAFCARFAAPLPLAPTRTATTAHLVGSLEGQSDRSNDSLGLLSPDSRPTQRRTTLTTSCAAKRDATPRA